MDSKEPVSGVNETGSNGNNGTFWHIFLEPSRCFEGLNLKPRWLIPMFLSIIMTLAASFIIYSRIDMEHVIRDQIASSQSASQLTEGQLQQQGEMGAKFGKVSSLVAPVIIMPLFIFLVAGLIMLGVYVLGSEIPSTIENASCSACGKNVPLKSKPGDQCPHCGVVWGAEYQTSKAEGASAFKKVLSVTASSLLFYNVVAGILSIAVVMVASDPNSLNVQNLVSTNPAFRVDVRESKVLYNFLSHLDILVWYTLYLFGLGISKICQKCTVSKGIIIIGFWYLLYSLAHTGLSALF